jgi:hypothetical protein
MPHDIRTKPNLQGHLGGSAQFEQFLEVVDV